MHTCTLAMSWWLQLYSVVFKNFWKTKIRFARRNFALTKRSFDSTKRRDEISSHAAKFRFGSSSSLRNFVDVRTIDASRFSHFFVWMESSQFVRRNSQISATSAFISFAQYCTSTCFQSWHSSSKKFKTKHLVNSSARNSRIAAWLRLLKALVSLSKLAAIIGFERLC